MSAEQLPFPALPYDNNLQIASYLNLNDLMRTRLVSKLWKRCSFWCIAAVDTPNFEQLLSKCNILLGDYFNNPTLEAREFIATFFSRIVKTKIAELEKLQKKVKEDYDRHKLVGAVLQLPDALEDAPRKYPRLLLVVQELSDLTNMLWRLNLDLANEHKIRPVLSEFMLWFDYAENNGHDCPIIYFDYWQLFTGVISYQSSISIENACLYNISIADDRNSSYFEEHLLRLKGADLAYNIRFIAFETFSDFDKDFEPQEDPELVKMNRRSQFRFCEKLRQERLELQKKQDKLMEELIRSHDKEDSSVLTSTDVKDREIASLKIQLRKREVEIQIQKSLLNQSPPSLVMAIQLGYDHDNTKMAYYDKIQPGYLEKRDEINALIQENIRLRGRVTLLQQQLAQVKSSQYKQDERISEKSAFTSAVARPSSRRNCR